MSRLLRPASRVAPAAFAALAITLCVGLAAPADAASLTATAAAAATPVGSQAAPPSIDDPIAVISAIAPELLSETRQPATAEQRAEIRRQGGGAAFDAQIPQRADDPLLLSPTETEGSGLPTAITMDDAEGQARTTQGITSFSGASTSPSSATYVQPVDNGVRLLTALAAPSAGDAFHYTFDLPEGSYPTELPTGETLLSTAEHHYIGSLQAPWARDATGADLATSYTWEGTTLTQHVTLTPTTAYPVLLDPLWLYSYDYSTSSTGWSVNYPKATDLAVNKLLRGCFNCYFPIFGAPRSYPYDGQVLPLSITPFTWTATMAPVKVRTANGGALQFVALPRHFDGEGSTITFSWYNDPSGYIHLYVHAMVMVDNGPFLNHLNARAAGANWLLYWKKVADSANGTSGGGV
jgi:hypothetical protein